MTRHTDTLGVWDLDTGQSRGLLLADRAAESLQWEVAAVSQDGTEVIAGEQNGRLWRWAVATDQLWQLPCQPDLIDMATDLTGQRLAVALQDKMEVRLLGKDAQRIGAFQPPGRGINIVAIGEGDVATGTKDNVVSVWHDEQLQTLRSPGGLVTALAFSPKGDALLGGTKDGALFLWKRPAARDWPTSPTRTLLGAWSMIAGSFSEDEQFVVAVNNMNEVLVWSTGETGVRLDLEHSGAIRGLVVSPDGRWIVTGADDRRVRLWDAATGALLPGLGPFIQTVSGVAVAPNQSWFVAASEDRTARVLPFSQVGRAYVELGASDPQGTRPSIIDVAVSSEGRVALSYADGQVEIWEPRWQAMEKSQGHLLDTLPPGPAPAPVTVAWSHDGRRLVTGRSDGHAVIWEFTPADRSGKAGGGESQVPFARLGSWELKDATEPVAEGEAVTGAIFSPDDQRVLTAHKDGTVQLWQAATGRREMVLERGSGVSRLSPNDGGTATDGGTASNEARTTRVLFSPRGDLVLAAGRDGVVRLWDAAHGRLVHRLEGHQGAVLDAAFSSDGQEVASVGQDGTLRLWNTSTGMLEGRIEAHSGSIVKVAYALGGTRVVTAGLDGRVRVWPARLATILEVLCEGLQRVPQNEPRLTDQEMQVVCGQRR